MNRLYGFIAKLLASSYSELSVKDHIAVPTNVAFIVSTVLYFLTGFLIPAGKSEPIGFAFPIEVYIAMISITFLFPLTLIVLHCGISYCCRYITDNQRDYKLMNFLVFKGVRERYHSLGYFFASWAVFFMAVSFVLGVILSLPSVVQIAALGGAVALVLAMALLRIARTVYRLSTKLNRHVNDKELHR